ncbi:retrotransposon hot spot (RHS) protein [Trypanosoma conorhini]|uniref:Retrotransposon hot spot (RHS) protein n=1 Tax=Trypanosoma conorhini TaxID=83891 RepID=A0A3R7LVC1_9TRYP|nr:retrotransposon hot spot (RHS) protein [Trypanosoma conorhini]RNF21358.1 retrotransposon hot spot (RHS) protein [Trypanosoma conorhini]
MSGRREEGIHAAAEGNSAADAPQGRRWGRAGPGSGDSNQRPAARRPRWTLDSSVEEVLLAGSVRVEEARLNDFLCSELGGRGVAEANGNVSMGEFVLEPGKYITSCNLLHDVISLPTFRAHAFREAARALRGRGVFSLWGLSERSCRGDINFWAKRKVFAALDEAVEQEYGQRREEKRQNREEAWKGREEARKRREGKQRAKLEEERARARAIAEARAEELKQLSHFTTAIEVEDLLLAGSVRVGEAMLNDFIRSNFGPGKGVEEDRNVPMREFVRDPGEYVADPALLEGILRLPAYRLCAEARQH